MRREEGTAAARIVIGRAGNVVSARLEQSSGSAALDSEALALIERAQPLPALPDDYAANTMELVVPLRFQLR
jgi:protein TonB